VKVIVVEVTEETVDDGAMEPIENSTADGDIPKDDDKQTPADLLLFSLRFCRF